MSGTSWDNNGWSVPGFENLGDGVHVIYFMVDDDAGNVSGTTGEWAWQFHKDTTFPTIVYHSPQQGGSTGWYVADRGMDIDIDFSWVGDAPLDFAAYQIGDGPWRTIFTTDRSSDYTQNWGVDWNSLSEGENAISLIVVDKAGNGVIHAYWAGLAGFLFRKDTAAPVPPAISSSTHPLSSVWYSHNDLSLTWDIVPDVSGIAGYSYELDDQAGTIPDGVIDGANGEAQYPDLTDGIRYFHCRAVDGSGQWGSASHYAVRIDMTAPGSPQLMTVDPAGWTRTNQFAVRWTNPEDLSGIASAYYRFDMPPVFDTDGSAFSGQPLLAELPQEGRHTLFLWLKDAAGNINLLQAVSVELAFDASGPLGGTIAIEGDAPQTDTLEAQLTGLGAEDAWSGVVSMQFSNDGQTWSPEEAVDSVRSGWDLSGCGGTTDSGMKIVSVRYGDAAGNWSESFSDSILYTIPLRIVTQTLSPAIRNLSYAARLEASGGKGTYTWSIVSGSLPAGLCLGVAGDISGVPTSPDTLTTSFTVQVMDTSLVMAQKGLSITVSDRLKGDATGDGTINILDAIMMVNMILTDECSLVAGDECWSADLTGDGRVDIIDVINVVRAILGQFEPTPKMPVSHVSVRIEEQSGVAPEGRAYSVFADADLPVAGAQFTFRAEGVSEDELSLALTRRSEAMRMVSGLHGGSFTILLFSPQGEMIPAGDASLVRVALRAGHLNLEQVLLVDARGQTCDTDMFQSVVQDEPVTYGQLANYPNPFNPITTISYTIPVQSIKSKVESGEGTLNSESSTLYVTLKIFNVMGQEVATLVEGMKQPGFYTVSWNGSQMPSGIYFCRLTAGDFSETRRMALMK